MKLTALLSLALLSLVGACAPSLVYDPSLQISHRPMKQSDVQGVIGASYLLETRPDAVQRNGDAGNTLILRGAFTKDVTIGVRYWMTFAGFDPDNTYRAGLSGDIQLDVGDQTGDTRLSLLGRGGMLIDDQSINGGGFSLQAVAVRSFNDLFGAYAGIGPVFGFRDLTATPDQWGVGVIANLGASLTPADALSIGVEIAGVGAYDANIEKAVGGVSPSLFLSLTF